MEVVNRHPREITMINGFQDAVKEIKDVIEYTFHCNDYSFREAEGKICDAFDKLAKDNGEPEINWEDDDADA